MDTKILKCLLNHQFYSDNKHRLDGSLFGDEVEELYEVVAASHEKYGHDISTDELFALWQADNPVAVRAKIAAIKDIVEKIAKEEAFSPDIAADLIYNLWKRENGRRITELGIAISEGKSDAYERLVRLIEQNKAGILPDDFPPSITTDLDVLLALDSDENRWRFNINALSTQVYGIGPSDFCVVFARPETGKTGFGVSLAVSPRGFCEQGAKVWYGGNEEAPYKTMVRAICSASGMTKQEVITNPRGAKEAFESVRPNWDMQEITDWSLDRIDAYVNKTKPDIVIIDQLDKVKIPGNFDNQNHQRLRELYLQAREIGKRHRCAIIGMSQASNDAENKTVITPDMMEGSKTGKYAEADLILGIGKYPIEAEGDDPIRFITIGKNKISGWHGTVSAKLDGQTSRYMD